MMAFRQFKKGQERTAHFQKSLECEEEEEEEYFHQPLMCLVTRVHDTGWQLAATIQQSTKHQRERHKRASVVVVPCIKPSKMRLGRTVNYSKSIKMQSLSTDCGNRNDSFSHSDMKTANDQRKAAGNTREAEREGEL